MSGASQFIVATFIYAIFIVGMNFNGFQSTHELHSIVETCATLIAAFVAFLALIRYFARRDLKILMISAAFFGTMLLNAFHVVVSSNFFLSNFAGVWSTISPWSWMAERLFLGLYLLAAADTMWTVEHDHFENKRLTSRAVLAAFLLGLSSIVVFAVIPLPDIYLQDAWIGRPQEIFPSFFFLLTFLAFLRLNHWRENSVDLWMLHSLLLALISAVTMAFSNNIYDSYFDTAHVLKTLSYLILLIGLSRDIYRLYGDEERTRGRLNQHEQLLAEAQEIAHVGNWEWNLESNEIYWSDELHNLFAVKPGHFKVTFENYLSLIHTDDRDMVNRLVQECHKTGASYEMMHRVGQEGDDVRWLQCRGKAVRDSAGEISRLVGTAQDVTEIHLNEERFRNLLEAAPDGMVICDEAGKITLINAQTESLFGYKREELLGVSMEILIPSKYRDQHTEHREKYFMNPGTRNMGKGLDLSGLRKNGSEFPVEVSLSPFKTRNGRMVIAAVRDVTESRKAQKSLARYAAELERSNAELERFAYVASHDMKEPLRKIQAFGDRLSSRYADVLDDTARDYVNRMRDAAARMSMLINDMLTYSRIEIRSGAWEKVDMQLLLNSTLQSLDMVIQDTHAEMTVQALPEVEGHPWQLEMLLQNLLSNALKYRYPGRTPKISVLVNHDQPESGWTEIIIQDNGIGFDSDYAEKIFQPFERLHSNKEYPGTGIGLSICRKIAEHHGGKITASGVPGAGSRFEIHLPNKQVVN